MLDVMFPEVPVTVTVYCPSGVVLLVVNVKDVLYEVGFGLKEAVTPLGRPEAESVTFPEKPYNSLT
jgi:hypothetical protein